MLEDNGELVHLTTKGRHTYYYKLNKYKLRVFRKNSLDHKVRQGPLKHFTKTKKTIAYCKVQNRVYNYFNSHSLAPDRIWATRKYR